MGTDLADDEFPNVGLRTLSALVHLIGTAVLSVCLARRVALEDLDTWRGWRTLSLARLTIILIFAVSLAFIMVTGLLVHGIGLELSRSSCALGIFSCIVLYTSSKVLIYIFLSEKVWIVWANMGHGTPSASLNLSLRRDDKRASSGPVTATTASSASASTIMYQRLQSPVYRLCFISIALYTAVFVLMLVYRIANLRDADSRCVIGLGKIASIPLLSYDAYITVLLTALFVWPLWSNKVMSHRLRRLATRTLVASFIALLTSTINIAVLTRLNGHELGWICLASCGTDVMINALVLDFVTESRLKRAVRLSRTRSRANNHGVQLSGIGMGSSGNGPNLNGIGASTGVSSGLATSSSTPNQSQQPGPGRRHRAGVRGMVKSGVYGHGTTHSVELRVSMGVADADIDVDMVAGTRKLDSTTGDSSGLLPPGSLSFAGESETAVVEGDLKAREMMPQASSSQSTTISIRPPSIKKVEDEDVEDDWDYEGRTHTPTPLATPPHIPHLEPLRFARPPGSSQTSQEAGVYDDDDEMSSGDEFEDFQRPRKLSYTPSQHRDDGDGRDDASRSPSVDPSSAPPRLLTFDEALRAVDPFTANSNSDPHYLQAHSITNCNSSTFSNSTSSNRDTFNSTFGSTFNQFIVRPPPASASLFHPASSSRRPSTSPHGGNVDRAPLPRPLSLTGFKFGTAGSGSAGPNPSITPPTPPMATYGLRSWSSRLASFPRKRPSTAPDGAGPRRRSDVGISRGSILPTHVHAPLGMSSDWGVNVEAGPSSSSGGGVASWRRRMSMPMTPDEIVLDDLYESPGALLAPPPSPRGGGGRKGKDRDVRRGSGAGVGTNDGEGPAGLSRLFSVPRASPRQPQPTPIRVTPLRDSTISASLRVGPAAVSESHADTKIVVGGAG